LVLVLLTGRIANAREESQRLGQSVEDRFAVFDERIKETERRIESSLGLEERLRLAEEGIGSNSVSVEILPRLEARLKQAEGNIASNSASTQILTRLEARLRQAEESIASNSASTQILTRLEARLKQIEESIASSAASDGIEARLEARLNFAEERTQEALERYFASMGRNLEEIASRLEKTESRAEPDTGIQDALRSLGTRIDAAEKKNREALADLEANLGEATTRIENFETARPTTGPLAPLPELTPLPEEETTTGSEFDLPPFPEEPLLDVEGQQTSGDVEYFSQAAASEPAEAIASESQSPLSLPENYLAHARRAAQAAAEPEAERGQRAKFRIPFPGEAELALASDNAPKRSRRGSQPLALAALILLLVALTVAGGVVIGAAAGAQQQPRVRDIQKIRDNLYFISGGDTNDRSTWTGGNVAVLVAERGVVVVDTMLAKSGNGILERIRTVTDKPVTTIINTHFDHNSGNVEFSGHG